MSSQTIENVSQAHLLDAGDALKLTIEAMPEGVRDAFMRDLMVALYAHSETGDESRLKRVVNGLLISSRLRNQEDYQEALSRADSFDWEPGTDVADYLSKLHATRSRT